MHQQGLSRNWKPSIVSFTETLLLFCSQLFGWFLRILVLLQGLIQNFSGRLALGFWRGRRGADVLIWISQFGVSKNTCARRDKKKHIFFFFCHAKYTHELALKIVFLRYAWFYPDARTCFLKLRTSLLGESGIGTLDTENICKRIE